VRLLLLPCYCWWACWQVPQQVSSPAAIVLLFDRLLLLLPLLSLLLLGCWLLLASR
jgi:hypothetical protein